MTPVFDQKRKDKTARFIEQQGTGRTAIGIDEILPAAFYGKVDALFCENKADIFGSFHKDENNSITVKQSEENDQTVSLMNVAAIQTFLNGGDVYLLKQEEMPNPASRISALFRY